MFSPLHRAGATGRRVPDRGVSRSGIALITGFFPHHRQSPIGLRRGAMIKCGCAKRNPFLVRDRGGCCATVQRNAAHDSYGRCKDDGWPVRGFATLGRNGVLCKALHKPVATRHPGPQGQASSVRPNRIGIKPFLCIDDGSAKAFDGTAPAFTKRKAQLAPRRSPSPKGPTPPYTPKVVSGALGVRDSSGGPRHATPVHSRIKRIG